MNMIQVNFTSKNIKQKDVESFRKLWVKLGVSCKPLPPTKLKGQKILMVILDEVGDIEE